MLSADPEDRPGKETSVPPSGQTAGVLAGKETDVPY